MTGDALLPLLASIGATCVALAFLVAAAGKLRDRDAFEGVVANYRLLPSPAVPIVAAGLPWVEVATGLGLLAHARAAGVAGVVMLVLFALGIAINLLRGRREIDCGCGGLSAGQPLSWALVARNVGLLLLLLPLLAAPGGAEPLARVAGMLIGATLFFLALTLSLVTTIAAQGRALRS